MNYSLMDEISNQVCSEFSKIIEKIIKENNIEDKIKKIFLDNIENILNSEQFVSEITSQVAHLLFRDDIIKEKIHKILDDKIKQKTGELLLL